MSPSLKRFPTTLLLAPVLCLASLIAVAAPARADTDWKTVLTGIDGVVVYCEATTRESYAPKICDAIAKAAKAGFDGGALPVADAGITYTGSAARDGENADPARARAAHEFTRPLFLRAHIKGTDDNNPAIYVGLSAILEFAAATEEGSDLPGKPGDLVVGETHTVSNGPRKQLAGFLAKHWTGRTKELVDEIRSGL